MVNPKKGQRYLPGRSHRMRKRRRGGEVTGAPTRTGAFNFAFELLAARTRSPGEVAPRIGELLAPVLDMKHIAVAGRVAQAVFCPARRPCAASVMV